MDIQLLQEVNALKAALDALRPISPEIERRVLQKFRLDWNFHSNHIEGNTLTYGETKALILSGLTAQAKPMRDHFEMTGHDDAIKSIEEVIKEDRPLSEAFIRELHHLLLRETVSKKIQTPDGQILTRTIEVGKYKSSLNHVRTLKNEIIYFASPEETPALMNDLMDWYRQQRNDASTNPILLATEFHYKFIKIHPFDDGNGRTARLLMNFVLMSYGFPPVIIKTTEKEQYINVLRAADAGNINPFITFITQNLIASLTLMLKAAKGEPFEEEEDVFKELALLKRKLQDRGHREILLKNEAIMNDLWHNSISKFIEKANEDYKKAFDDFYYANGIFFKHEYKDESSKELNNLYALEIDLSSSSFRFTGAENLHYYQRIIINFRQNYYVFYKNEHEILKKYYGEQLTEAESTKIIQDIIKEHSEKIKEAMEQKS